MSLITLIFRTERSQFMQTIGNNNPNTILNNCRIDNMSMQLEFWDKEQN